MAGDRNTGFFHKLASQRRRNNTIHMVHNDVGEEIRDHEGIVYVFFDYFTKLFTTSDPTTVAEVVDRCHSRIKDHDKAFLSGIFTKDGVYVSVKDAS